jgi:ketosteroid isomerase-like protein
MGVEVDNGSTPAAVIRETYAKWARGNMHGFAEYIAPDVIFRSPATMGKPVHGHDGVRGLLSDILSTVSDWSIELEELIESGDRVFVRERQRALGRKSGVPLDVTYYAAFLVRDGLITEGFWFDNRADALDAARITDVRSPVS